jgi:hypothetical protein
VRSLGYQRACVDCGFRWGVARSFVFLIVWGARVRDNDKETQSRSRS